MNRTCKSCDNIEVCHYSKEGMVDPETTEFIYGNTPGTKCVNWEGKMVIGTKAVDENPIVVPDMMPSIYTGKDMEKTGYIDEVARYKIDEVIMCLQQIKERLE